MWTEETRELIDDCKFLSDIIIDLTVDDDGFRYIEVKKKRYGPYFSGKYRFDICHKHHRLSNIETNAPSGIIVYPSIPRFLEESRIDPYSIKDKVHTGITHLDSILTYSGSAGKITGDSIEKNACIVISGERGNHKLTFGLNILIGGLWEIEKEKEKVVSSDKDVLLISLDEPTNLLIDKSALAYNTHVGVTRECCFKEKGLDNGAWIKWRDSTADIDKVKCHPRDLESNSCIFNKTIDDYQTGRNDHKSIFLNRWCAYIGDEKRCNSLIVASYRPGRITPDEFLYSLSRLIESEDQYEEVEILDKIFKIRIPSIDDAESKTTFDQLKSEGLIIEREGKNILNTEAYKPEVVWKLFDVGNLENYKKEREAIISILNDYKRKKIRFSRVLFHSTAFLQSRFPLLYREPLFLIALANYFKSKDIMSIFINNTDKGYDEKISHHILSSADYIIELNRVESMRSDYSWSKLTISTAKAEPCVQTPHYISVQQKEGHNELIMSDALIVDNRR
jgi:hypothetical protein